LKTQETITKLRWTVFPHPPHSPDIVPSDISLFGALKGASHGKRFGSDDKVIEDVKKRLQVQNSNWYKKGTDALLLAGTRLLKSMEIMWKNEVCNTSV
jgi:hypothetical protein